MKDKYVVARIKKETHSRLRSLSDNKKIQITELTDIAINKYLDAEEFSVTNFQNFLKKNSSMSLVGDKLMETLGRYLDARKDIMQLDYNNNTGPISENILFSEIILPKDEDKLKKLLSAEVTKALIIIRLGGNFTKDPSSMSEKELKENSNKINQKKDILEKISKIISEAPGTGMAIPRVLNGENIPNETAELLIFILKNKELNLEENKNL